MRVGLIGAGRRGTAWAHAVRAAGPGLVLAGVADASADAAGTLARATGARAFASTLDLLDAADLALVAVPVRDRALVASEALRRGLHTFVLWPPAASVAEVEALGRLAEEAGREVAVAHALPIAPLLAARPPGWTPTLALLGLAAPFAPPPAAPAALDRTDGAEWSSSPWPHVLAGACGLLGALARSPVRRLDAEAVRGDTRALRRLAASARFRSGCYAQLTLRRAAAPSVRLCLSDGSGERVETTFGPERAARAAEIRQLVDAVAAGRPAPHGPLEAADTLRLTERILRRMA